jgi:GTP-binding protein
MKALFLGSFPGELPAPTLPEIAFAGRSNVGKSSAINAIVGQKGLCRTSGTPGRTQAINLFQLDDRWIAADLPGYGYAKVSKGDRAKWKTMIADYFGHRPTLRLVVVFVDSRIPPQESDSVLIQGLRAYDLPMAILATKIDGVTRSKREAAVATLGQAHGIPASRILPFSAHEGIGVEDARTLLYSVSKP